MTSVIEDIVEQFGLEPGTRVEVRSQLRQLLKQYHPDGSGGNFESAAQRRIYDSVVEAMGVIDAMHHRDPATQGRELVEVVARQSELLARQNEELNRQLVAQRAADRLQGLQASAMNIMRSNAAQRFLPVKLSGGLIAAIGVFVTASGESVASLLSVTPAVSSLISGVLVLSGAMLALLAFVEEERTRARKQTMLSEPIFERFLRSPAFSEVVTASPGGLLVTMTDLADAVLVFSRRGGSGLRVLSSPLAWFFNAGLDEHEAEQIAEVMAERLVADLSPQISSRFW